MRVLLRPVLVPELGLVVVKPGRESMPVFHNTRVLVEPEPKSMRNLPSGVVPAVRQPLVEDKTLLPFFSNARVIRAAGGAGALSDWLLRHIKSCQWPHGDYHHSETVIHRYGTGAMVLCWHCDNQLRDQTSESLEQLAHQNLSAWMIDVIGHAISGTQERELSLAELTAIISALVICIIVGLSWAVNHYRDNAITYKAQRDKNARELKLANAAITDMQMRQRDVAALDAKYTKELADAKAENDALRDDVAAGRRRLHIKAVCQSVREATTASGVDNAASPRLADTAERDYFTLRERLITMQKQLEGTQKYINEQCR